MQMINWAILRVSKSSELPQRTCACTYEQHDILYLCIRFLWHWFWTDRGVGANKTSSVQLNSTYESLSLKGLDLGLQRFRSFSVYIEIDVMSIRVSMLPWKSKQERHHNRYRECRMTTEKKIILTLPLTTAHSVWRTIGPPSTSSVTRCTVHPDFSLPALITAWCT